MIGCPKACHQILQDFRLSYVLSILLFFAKSSLPSEFEVRFAHCKPAELQCRIVALACVALYHSIGVRYMTMDHLGDDLSEMLSQVAKDLVKVSAALLNDDTQDQRAPPDRGSSSRIGPAQRMTGGTGGVPQYSLVFPHFSLYYSLYVVEMENIPIISA